MALVKKLPNVIKDILKDIYDKVMDSPDYNYVEYGTDGVYNYKVHAKAEFVVDGEPKSVVIRIVQKDI